MSPVNTCFRLLQSFRFRGRSLPVPPFLWFLSPWDDFFVPQHCLGILSVIYSLLSQSHQPFSLPSAPVLCLRPLSGAGQPGPCLGGPAPGFPVCLAGLPLPSLPALGSGAFSACSSRPHSCWERRQGGRERRGRIRESRFGACCNSGKTQPAPLQLSLSASEPRALTRVWPLPFLVRWRWLFHFPGLPSI